VVEAECGQFVNLIGPADLRAALRERLRNTTPPAAVPPCAAVEVAPSPTRADVDNLAVEVLGMQERSHIEAVRVRILSLLTHHCVEPQIMLHGQRSFSCHYLPETLRAIVLEPTTTVKKFIFPRTELFSFPVLTMKSPLPLSHTQLFIETPVVKTPTFPKTQFEFTLHSEDNEEREGNTGRYMRQPANGVARLHSTSYNSCGRCLERIVLPKWVAHCHDGFVQTFAR
jgi:hypothetical protein